MNQGLLFLSGGGGAQDSVEVDSLFVRSLPKKATILYLPHANAKQSDDYSPSIQWLTATLNNVNHLGKSISIDTPLNLELVESIDKYDAIYIGGGNTYRLMHILRKTGLDTRIKRYVQSGGRVYGGSAGAIIFGRTIASAKDARVGYESSPPDGLDLLGGLSLLCHYNKDDSTLVSLESQDHPTICLYENSALYVNNSVITSIGKAHDILLPNNY